VKKLLLLAMLLSAAPVFAHDCCCGGMDRLSAETVKRMEKERFAADLAEAREEFKGYGELLNRTELASPWYDIYEKNYNFWSRRLERLQGKAINEADWERIDAEIDAALDNVYQKVR